MHCLSHRAPKLPVVGIRAVCLTFPTLATVPATSVNGAPPNRYMQYCEGFAAGPLQDSARRQGGPTIGRARLTMTCKSEFVLPGHQRESEVTAIVSTPSQPQ